MQSSNTDSCCFIVERHAEVPAGGVPMVRFEPAAAVACVSQEATSALNSLGAAPVRVQFQDPSGSARPAQPPTTIKTGSATYCIQAWEFIDGT
jgi:hypothetical protein